MNQYTFLITGCGRSKQSYFRFSSIILLWVFRKSSIFASRHISINRSLDYIYSYFFGFWPLVRHEISLSKKRWKVSSTDITYPRFNRSLKVEIVASPKIGLSWQTRKKFIRLVNYDWPYYFKIVEKKQNVHDVEKNFRYMYVFLICLVL